MTPLEQARAAAPMVLDGRLWVIRGIYPYYDERSIHCYDVVRFVAPPAVQRDGPRIAGAPHRCGQCEAVYVHHRGARRGSIVEMDFDDRGDLYHVIVPICPSCWVEGPS